MDITITERIKGPRITEKAYKLNQRNQLVLEIHPQVNVKQIAEALRKLFNVEAQSIRTATFGQKRRRVGGRREVIGKLRKKVYITLKPGSSIDLMGLSQSVTEEAANAGERKE